MFSRSNYELFVYDRLSTRNICSAPYQSKLFPVVYNSRISKLDFHGFSYNIAESAKFYFSTLHFNISIPNMQRVIAVCRSRVVLFYNTQNINRSFFRENVLRWIFEITSTRRLRILQITQNLVFNALYQHFFTGMPCSIHCTIVLNELCTAYCCSIQIRQRREKQPVEFLS